MRGLAELGDLRVPPMGRKALLHRGIFRSAMRCTSDADGVGMRRLPASSRLGGQASTVFLLTTQLAQEVPERNFAVLCARTNRFRSSEISRTKSARVAFEGKRFSRPYMAE
jgi:hypothetical protein